VVGSRVPILSAVSVVVDDGGTVPDAGIAGAFSPSDGAGQERPAGLVVVVAVGVEVPPQAVASRATPTLRAVSLATRGAAGGSEIIDNLLDRKVRTAFDADDQVFLI
jgi:hypothetical protein